MTRRPLEYFIQLTAGVRNGCWAEVFEDVRVESYGNVDGVRVSFLNGLSLEDIPAALLEYRPRLSVVLCFKAGRLTACF